MRKVVKVLLLVVVVNASIFLGLDYYFFHSMASLPKGEYICESMSPDGDYTIKLYYTNPALSSGGTRGELTINRTNRKRNVYWENNRYLFEAKHDFGLKISGIDIEWGDNDTALINGIRLNLPGDKYDWRKDRMAFLPQGDYICESTSPQGRYTIKLFSTDPTTAKAGTRGELIINRSGKTRNIYWENNREILENGMIASVIFWESEDIVIINGIRLSLPNEKYDWSRDRLSYAVV